MEIKIYLKEKNKIIERRLTRKMICCMFDLQYMLGKDVLDTVKLNKMEKEILRFFKIISFLDNKMHKMEVNKK